MRKYSFIFKKLVVDEKDLVGLLAYSIYKKQKIEHIEKYVSQNGSDPTEDDLDRFHQFTSSDTQIDQYLTTAENNLNEFIDTILSTKANDVEQFYRKAFKDAARESRQGFWYPVWQGVVSSFLYTLLLGLIFFFLWSLQLGPKQVLEKAFKVQIIPDTTKSATQ